MLSNLLQSKSLAKHIEKNPSQNWELVKFLETPQLQEKYMDQVLMPAYKAAIADINPEKTKKYSDEDLYYIMHHDGVSAGKANVKTNRYRSGSELLDEYMIDSNGNFKSDDNVMNALEAITNETEKGLFKLAINKLEGPELTIKESIGEIETDPNAYGTQGIYRIINPDSTAVGKYQVMWTEHFKKDSKLMDMLSDETEPSPQKPSATVNVQAPAPVEKDSIDNTQRFK